MLKFDSTLAKPSVPTSAVVDSFTSLGKDVCCQPDAALGGGDPGNGNDDSSSGNNRNGNNNNKHNRGGGSGGHDGDAFRRTGPRLDQALLGAFLMTVGVAAFPAQSYAIPGSMSSSPANSPFSGSYKDSPLSCSAPTRGGSLADSLDRLSFDPSRGGRGSSSGYSPARPRSKVLHVSCKGGTLVVPLPAGGDVKAATSLPRRGPFQRSKVVEAPIELSGREAAIVDQRQYRVRESMLV